MPVRRIGGGQAQIQNAEGSRVQYLRIKVCRAKDIGWNEEDSVGWTRLTRDPVTATSMLLSTEPSEVI